MSNQKHEFRGLDGLRGLMALIVLGAHGFTVLVRPYTGVVADGAYQDFPTLAWVLAARLAVLGFFVLSGFVIMHSLMLNARRHGSVNLSQFALARCRRILPPLLAVIVLAVALVVGMEALGKTSLPSDLRSERSEFLTRWPDQLLSLITLCLRGDLTGYLNGPLWSLVYEIQCYVVIGLLAAAFAAKSIALRAFAIVAAAAYIYALSQQITPLHLLCYACFALGVLARWLSRPLSGLLLVLGCALVAVSIGVLFVGGHQNLQGWIGQFAFALGFALIVVHSAHSGVFRTLAVSGDFSYSLYIVHFPVLLVFFFLLHPLSDPWLIYAIALPACLAVAFVMSILFERPLQRMRANRVPAPQAAS